MQIFARDVCGLLDALSINAAHVYGVSMGGMIAQEFALSYLQKVKTLILGCTTCGGIQQMLPADDVLAFLLDEERVNRITPEQAAREMFDFTCTKEFIEDNPDVVEKYIATTVAYAAPSYSLKRQAEAILTHDTYERLPQIEMPTLVIAGGEDMLVPNENSRLLASRIPGAELVIMENVGHGFFYQAAEVVNRIISDFIKRH
jgi:pimeloyl-ACP methyl ester carboxylesterase